MDTPMTSDFLLAQARIIQETIHLLRIRMTARHAAFGGCSSEKSLGPEITNAQITAMMTVHRKGQVTVKELSELLRVTPASASVMVDRLTGLDLLVREQNPKDRREVLVRVSLKGTCEIESLERAWLNSIIELLEGLGPEDAQKWCDVYTHLRKLLTENKTHEVSDSL